MAETQPSTDTEAARMLEPIDGPVSHQQYMRRIDWRLIPLLALINLCCFLDRSNIGNARLLNLEEDLGLTQAQYSMCISIFFIGYILCEIPSNMALKVFRPSRWISRIMITWGALSMCMAAVRNGAGLMA
ncbi:hypothetical protein H4R34_003789, partial [Dimargaris verticillata]